MIILISFSLFFYMVICILDKNQHRTISKIDNLQIIIITKCISGTSWEYVFFSGTIGYTLVHISDRWNWWWIAVFFFVFGSSSHLRLKNSWSLLMCSISCFDSYVEMIVRRNTFFLIRFFNVYDVDLIVLKMEMLLPFLSNFRGSISLATDRMKLTL